ncbi:MAG TPA: tetratricopeptide repeat protein [Bryobacteraceae bacterium]|nr:tetratricopeptide repeat protein [Bryobacteraceae bacterium]
MKVLCCFLLLAALAGAQAPAPETFDDLASRAQSLVDSSPAEAVTLFRKALAQRPSWPEGWMYMGGDLFRLQRYAEARDAFRKGIELAPKLGTAYGFLGLCEYELGDYNEALGAIGQGEALGLGPNEGFVIAVRQRAALILAQAQAYDEALAQLGPLSRKGMNSPLIDVAIGLCALTIPKKPEALTPQELEVVNLAGKATWAGMSRKAEAEAAFRDLLAKYPDFPGVQYAFGVYEMEMDQRVALEAFEKELKNHPNHWPSMLVLAFLKTRDGDPEEGIRITEKAMKLEPARNRWIAQTAIGQAYLSMGEPAKAIVELEAAVKQQPNNDSIHFFLEQAYRQGGRKADALRERDAFVKLREQTDPMSLPTHPGLGRQESTGTAAP